MTYPILTIRPCEIAGFACDISEQSISTLSYTDDWWQKLCYAVLLRCYGTHSEATAPFAIRSSSWRADSSDLVSTSNVSSSVSSKGPCVQARLDTSKVQTSWSMGPHTFPRGFLKNAFSICTVFCRRPKFNGDWIKLTLLLLCIARIKRVIIKWWVSQYIKI